MAYTCMAEMVESGKVNKLLLEKLPVSSSFEICSISCYRALVVSLL